MVTLFANIWTKIAHGTRIVNLCSGSLIPITKRGLTVFHTLNKEATELTCSLRFKPGGKPIAGARLVRVALIALFMTVSPQSALCFCKGGWTTTASEFWAAVQVILAPAIDMPPTISTASKIENPNVRNFVLRSWYRLRSRLGYQETEKVLSEAIAHPWPNGSWTTTLCKWMKQLQTPLVITNESNADLFVGRIPIAIPKRDKIALSLMILFREPIAYGEKYSTSELSQALAFDTATALFSPQACSLHSEILLAMKHRTQFAP